MDPPDQTRSLSAVWRPEHAHAAQVDNVLWSGKVADDSIQDEDTNAIRELNAKIIQDDRYWLRTNLLTSC